jgi:glycosyltransferase involved in cell wall biosynthesis
MDVLTNAMDNLHKDGETRKMTEPLVSVKMITYNHAPYIARAIEGVLQQKTNFPFELVIGEDCSTDGTREIVFEYQRKHPSLIHVVASEKNLGAAANSRQTTEVCRGKYLAFCEGDDFWHDPSKLQKQVDYLEGHPECGLVYSSYDEYYPHLDKTIKDFIRYNCWEMPKSPTFLDFIEGTDKIGHGILTCTILLQRDIYDEVKASDPYLHLSGNFLMGDTQLWAELSTKTQLHYIAESLATHIMTEESATRSKDIKKVLRFSISHSEMMLYICNKYSAPSDIIAKHEAEWCRDAFWLAVYTRNGSLANEVRNRKKTLTWREWLRYCAAHNIVIHHAYLRAVYFRSLFRQKRDWKPWL